MEPKSWILDIVSKVAATADERYVKKGEGSGAPGTSLTLPIREFYTKDTSFYLVRLNNTVIGFFSNSVGRISYGMLPISFRPKNTHAIGLMVDMERGNISQIMMQPFQPIQKNCILVFDASAGTPG